MKKSGGDRVLEGVVIFILLLLCFTMLYPFWNSLVISFNDGKDTLRGDITFWPRVFSLQSYEFVFKNEYIIRAFFVTIARTVLGTLISIWFTGVFAYALTKKQLRLRKFYLSIAIFTMYFGGGMIPSYLLIRTLLMRNTLWALVLPGAVNVWNMIIFRTFFIGIPQSLEESAHMDGAGFYRILFQIVAPISLPVISTLALFTAVGHWNAWFDAAIYISDKNLMPIQNILQQLVNTNALKETLSKIGGTAAENLARTRMTTKSLTMATMIVATVPVLLIYPFIQRYFVHGVMIGSLKE